MNRIILAMLAITVMALSAFTARDSAMMNTQPTFSAEDESAVGTLVNEFANT